MNTDSPNFDLNYIKNEFSHLKSIYFNTAYFGPIPQSAKPKIEAALSVEMDPSFFPYSKWKSIPDIIREKIATLLNCPADNICHSTSVGDINNLVANGFEFQEGDRIAAINQDYPSNILPWMVAEKNTHATFDLLNLGDQNLPTVEWLQQNLSPKTKIFCVSYVTFETGKKVDILGIGKYLRDQDILFCVDVTQALGGMVISEEQLKYIDVLSCATYKWMLGPYGHAFAYFSDRALEKVRQTTGNWIVSPNSKHAHNLLNYTTDTLPGARMYDRGQSPNMLLMSCLEGSLDLLNNLGLENIEAHNKSLRDHFLSNYPKKKFELIAPLENLGNILSLKTKSLDIALEVEKNLKNKNIDVSVRQGNIRLSFHLFNTIEQVDILVDALDI